MCREKGYPFDGSAEREGWSLLCLAWREGYPRCVQCRRGGLHYVWRREEGGLSCAWRREKGHPRHAQRRRSHLPCAQLTNFCSSRRLLNSQAGFGSVDSYDRAQLSETALLGGDNLEHRVTSTSRLFKRYSTRLSSLRGCRWVK